MYKAPAVAPNVYVKSSLLLFSPNHVHLRNCLKERARSTTWKKQTKSKIVVTENNGIHREMKKNGQKVFFKKNLMAS